MSSQAVPWRPLDEEYKKSLAGFLQRFSTSNRQMLAPRFLLALLDGKNNELALFLQANTRPDIFFMPGACAPYLMQAETSNPSRRTTLKYAAAVGAAVASAVVGTTGFVKYLSKQKEAKARGEDPSKVSMMDVTLPYTGSALGLLIASALVFGPSISKDIQNDDQEIFQRLIDAMKQMEPQLQDALRMHKSVHAAKRGGVPGLS